MARPVRDRRGSSATLGEERGPLLLADIAGYTSYVVSSPIGHAEDVVAELVATVSQRLSTVVRLNKREGDAVFAYALDGEADGSLLLDAVEDCYVAFRQRVERIGHATSCSCNACAKLPDLDLKFVLHHGAFVRRVEAGGEELTGGAVIAVHRLLKNAVPERLGTSGYLLVSDAAAAALGLDLAPLGARRHVERYDDVGAIGALVVDLRRRYETERVDTPAFVGEAEAWLELETWLPVAPPVAWEFLTSPARRAAWIDDGPAPEPDATSYCVDGRFRLYEEILDWRPFRYFTERRTSLAGHDLVLTTELASADGGTRVVVRGARPQAGGRFAWAIVAPHARRGLRRNLTRLAKLVRTEKGALDARPFPAGREPEGA
jgi:hypothetical protein